MNFLLNLKLVFGWAALIGIIAATYTGLGLVAWFLGTHGELYGALIVLVVTSFESPKLLSPAYRLVHKPKEDWDY
jgi:hypothetical protein